MRPIHVVMIDRPRPALVLTRQVSRPHLDGITVAAITSRVHGLPVEVRVGPENGLERESVVNLDSVHTVNATEIGRRIGWLLDEQEPDLARAIAYAFDLQTADD